MLAGERMLSYRVKKECEGTYIVVDDEGERAARIAKFMPGPMVSVTGGSLTSPALAKAVAKAMMKLANDLTN
jgi:hypothetical protein